MNSHPGPDNGGCNTNCHPGFRRLVEGAQLEFDKLYYLNEILDYRQAQIAVAQIYCDALEIGIPEDQKVDQFDEVEWHNSLLIAKHEGSAERSKAAIDLLERFNPILGWVHHSDIFDSPRYTQGYSYSKPSIYLAARLAESPMPMEQIRKKVEDLSQCTYSLPNSYSDIF
jgi:hypothetical protein